MEGIPGTVYVGTGTGGLWKTTNWGITWTPLFDEQETISIGDIALDPQNPDIVWVGTGEANTRNSISIGCGIYKSVDGGKTRQKVFYIDEYYGASDLEIDPSNPNILYAGMWRFERKPWTHTSGSEQGGMFKSTDGRRTWRKVTNRLPPLLGRIDVKVAPSNPNVVYVIAESNDGTLFRSNDRGETFQRVSTETNIVSRGFYYTDLRVCPSDETR